MMERISGLWIPERLSSRQRAAENNQFLDEADKGKIASIIGALKSQDFSKLIYEGKITIGVIKPNAHQGKDLPTTDQEASSLLLGEVRDKAIFQISVKLTREDAEQFYIAKKEDFIKRYSETNPAETLWETNTKFMSSGPVTFVLICDHEGNAISWWREKIGHTFASQADPQSIRGKYALDENLPNNLVHGSDSVETVKSELAVLIGYLQRLIRVAQ